MSRPFARPARERGDSGALGQRALARHCRPAALPPLSPSPAPAQPPLPPSSADAERPDGPRWPDAARGRAALRGALPVALVFFAVYPAANAWTARRSEPFALYLPWELALPFVPQAIWAYLSLYLLFGLPAFFVPARRLPTLSRQLVAGTLLCGLVFLLLPGALGHARVLPADEPYRSLFALLYRVDAVHNVLPSLHVVYAALIGLGCADFARRGVRGALRAWVAVIAASTLLVHQHHLPDVAAAFALAAGLRHRWPLRPRPAAPRGG